MMHYALIDKIYQFIFIIDFTKKGCPPSMKDERYVKHFKTHKGPTNTIILRRINANSDQHKNRRF
jgi:hypothetical protein